METPNHIDPIGGPAHIPGQIPPAAQPPNPPGTAIPPGGAPIPPGGVVVPPGAQVMPIIPVTATPQNPYALAYEVLRMCGRAAPAFVLLCITGYLYIQVQNSNRDYIEKTAAAEKAASQSILEARAAADKEIYETRAKAQLQFENTYTTISKLTGSQIDGLGSALKVSKEFALMNEANLSNLVVNTSNHFQIRAEMEGLRNQNTKLTSERAQLEKSLGDAQKAIRDALNTTNDLLSQLSTERRGYEDAVSNLKNLRQRIDRLATAYHTQADTDEPIRELIKAVVDPLKTVDAFLETPSSETAWAMETLIPFEVNAFRAYVLTNKTSPSAFAKASSELSYLISRTNQLGPAQVMSIHSKGGLIIELAHIQQVLAVKAPSVDDWSSQETRIFFMGGEQYRSGRYIKSTMKEWRYKDLFGPRVEVTGKDADAAFPVLDYTDPAVKSAEVDLQIDWSDHLPQIEMAARASGFKAARFRFNPAIPSELKGALSEFIDGFTFDRVAPQTTNRFVTRRTIGRLTSLFLAADSFSITPEGTFLNSKETSYPRQYAARIAPLASPFSDPPRNVPSWAVVVFSQATSTNKMTLEEITFSAAPFRTFEPELSSLPLLNSLE